MNDGRIWDVIIAGGGPAGCNAAVVLGRSHRKVLVIDDGRQRNLKSQGMHNYLTRDDIPPAEYLQIVSDELKKYGVARHTGRVTKARKLEQHGFEVTDDKGNTWLCRRILLATGVTDNIPPIPGMQELWGCSVYHCPHCDGWECRHRIVGLYSRNINGYGMALALRQICEHIILFTDGRSYLRAAQRANLALRGIEVVSKPVAALRHKDKKLQGVELKNGKVVDCDALFVNNGHKVNDELLQQLNCRCTKTGAAITNKRQQTSVPGVYVAGDASYDIHFVIVAAAEGAKAAVAINNDLLAEDNMMV